MHSVDTAAWAVLPVLDVGPSRKRARFLSRLSLSNLSSLFSTPSPPAASTLDQIKQLAFSKADIDKEALTDALRPVAAFTTHLRDAVRAAENSNAKNTLSPSDIAQRGAALLAAYVHSAMATSRYIAAKGGQVKTVLNINGKRALDSDSDMDTGDRSLSQALLSSLEGMFQLYHSLRCADLIDTATEEALNTTESALLALPFADEPGLSPILTHAAALTEALRSSPGRRASLTPAPLPDPEVVEFAHSALHRLISGLRDVRTLPVPQQGATSKKAQTERERAAETRPLRLALEARLASAALARSMDNSAAVRRDDTESWDVRAERQLLECLEAAGEAASAPAKSKRFNVLLETVHAEDWLPEEWEWAGSSDADSATVKAEPEGSDDETEEDEEESEESEEEQDDLASPLAALLNLHTRYAEHRTGLWDVLPIGRPSQAAFVHARLGEPFDSLGAKLLRDLAPSRLIELGADHADVERWVARRSRGSSGPRKSGASVSGTSRGGSRAGSRASSRAPSRAGTPAGESHETPLESLKRRMTEEPPAKRQRKGSKAASVAASVVDSPRARAGSVSGSTAGKQSMPPPSPQATKRQRANSKSSRASVPPSPKATKAKLPKRPRAASRAKAPADIHAEAETEAAMSKEEPEPESEHYGAASLPTPESTGNTSPATTKLDA